MGSLVRRVCVVVAGLVGLSLVVIAPADAAVPEVQQAYAKASNTDPGDRFGHSVAVAGDTMVVGAPFEDSNATGINGDQADNSASSSGAAYVFVRSGDTWSQQAYLKASNTGAGDQFGWSVAISGDTVVVGASLEDSSATGIGGDQGDNSTSGSGAAYVFTRSDSTWTQQAYLKASNTDVADQFGWSVAISGNTVVVGAFGEDSNATGINGDETDNSAGASGAAYVFTRSGSTWTQQAYLKASNTGAGDQFGYSAAISGDTVVVGARFEDSNATGINGDQTDNSADFSGAAYAFTRSGSTWTQQAYLKASNTDTDAGDEFGSSVAISGDTVVVGAPLEASNATGINGDQADNSAVDSGAAYVFTRSGSTWSQQAYLKASNTDADDNFGHSAAISGDTVVVGAPLEASNATGINGNQTDNSAGFSGAAYAFGRSSGTWSQQAYLKASNTDGDNFGHSAAISGDTVVVGARDEDSNATGINGDQADNSAAESGAAYVFVTAGEEADLSIAKTDGVTRVRPGGPVSYTVSVSNAGPGEATGATVTDMLPASLTGATWTCAGASGGSCAASSGTGNIDTQVDLPSGGSVTFTIQATVSSTATGSISNTATVTAPSAVTDSDLANNSATDTDSVNVDTDDDGLRDVVELAGPGRCGTTASNPLKKDSDGDGLSDGAEVRGFNLRQPISTKAHHPRYSQVIGFVTTNACKKDTDGDGLSDRREVVGSVINQTIKRFKKDGGSYLLGTRKSNPVKKDTDGDTLADGLEVTGSANWRHDRHRSDPTTADTDWGGGVDGCEVFQWHADPAVAGE